jgi:hypothetical protein
MTVARTAQPMAQDYLPTWQITYGADRHQAACNQSRRGGV